MSGPIGIIGGGIGGLTVALALRAEELDIIVYESAPKLLEVGAGIWIQPNAMQVFERLGLAGRVREVGHPVDTIELADRREGVLKRIELGRLLDRYGHPIIGIERAALQMILVEALGWEHLRLGHEFVEYLGAGDDRIRARFQVREVSNEKAGNTTDEVISPRFGLLIGADGLHSRVRRQLFPGSLPRYSGQSSYRAIAELELPTGLERTSREIWDTGSRFGFSASGPGRVAWYASWEAPQGELDRAGKREERLAWFAARYPEPVPTIIEATPSEGVVRTDISDIQPLKRWHRGRVVLLGDAAHATTPNLGQGGAQAIEDGLALARALSEYAARPSGSEELVKVLEFGPITDRSGHLRAEEGPESFELSLVEPGGILTSQLSRISRVLSLG